ncbi:MAG: DeoR family transcriptional regulator [Janthinobacterium lividum]
MSLGSRSLVLQRRLKIAQRLRQHGITRVDTLSRELGVSVVTIRGDLAYLEEQGLVVRSAGGARSAAISRAEAASPVLSRDDARAMLLAAAGLVEDGSLVLLGPGRLVTQLATYLPSEGSLGLVLTDLSALPVARLCLDGALHVLGGQVHENGSTLDGPQSVQALALHEIELFVMQAQAIGAGTVALPADASEPFHRAATRRARRTVALVDGNGLHPAGNLPKLALRCLDHVILTEGAHHDALQALLDAGFRPARPPHPGASLFNKIKQDKETST